MVTITMMRLSQGWDVKVNCLSGDAKPTECTPPGVFPEETMPIPNGAELVEIDTGARFRFNEETSEWAIQPETEEEFAQDVVSLKADMQEVEGEVSDLKSAVNDVEYDVGILKSFHKNNLTWAQIKYIVQTGHAQDWFQIGDQIEVNWTKGSTVHSLPFDVVSFAPVIKEGSSDSVPGLWLQSHYTMDGVQFGASRAAYYCQEALAAGTYIFEITTTWSQAVAGKYQFTTTQEIPAGGQIVIGRNNDFYTWAAPDTAPSAWKVHTFSTVGSNTALETNLAVTTVSEGTALFTLSSAAKYNTNGEGNLTSCGYGYNRWAFSSMRKWLNSDAVAGQWWVASDNADRPAQQLATLDGFMKGFESDFLAALGKVKVTTALNTTSDSEIGASEVTYDTFFFPSLEQEYIVPQASGVEGAFWPYWKERLGLNSPQAQYNDGANVNHIRYAYDARTSAQACRLRSADRGYAYVVWYVSASGSVYGGNASFAFRGCPACVIC